MFARCTFDIQNTCLCPILFLLTFSLAYEAYDAAYETKIFARDGLNEKLCCPCEPEDSGAGQHSLYENCCPCALDASRSKIPLAPLRRRRASFGGVNEDASVVSCALITGDLLSSSPSCVSYKKERVDCFYVNSETQTVHQKIIDKGEPQESVDTEGKVRDEVVAVARSSSKFTLVALNTSNQLISRMVGGGRWTDWTTVEGAKAMEVPSTFMRNSGGVTCFYRSLDNALWYVDRSRYGLWDAPKKLNMESMGSAPTCLERGDGDAEECFALSANNSVGHEQWLFAGEWKLLAGLGGLGKRHISATSSGVDRLDVFMLGADNQLMHRAFVEEEWEEWENLGGNFVSSPECVAVGEESLHCFVVGVDLTLMHKSFDGEKWSEWFSASYAIIEKPSCVVTTATSIACYSRGFTGHMVETIYDLSVPSF